VGMARWLDSFADLVGIVVITEGPGRKSKRIKRELKRSGILGFIDILAYRIYHKFFLAQSEVRYEENELKRLLSLYAGKNKNIPIHNTNSPNSDETREYIDGLSPDFLIARCKTILKEKIFSIPGHGTYVMHPGVCPEYRNAHGCFWATVKKDYKKIGMTLLRVDKGVDTGPVYGYYSYDFDLTKESHNIIQAEVVFKNLDKLEDKFSEIISGKAKSIDTNGRESGVWGQPWLSKYLKWKLSYKKDKN